MLRTSVTRKLWSTSVDVRVVDMVQIMMSSNYLAFNSRATYLLYIGVGKMTINHEGVRPFLERLGKAARAAKILGTTHLDDQVLYISPEKMVLFMIHVANGLVSSEHNLDFLHAASLHRYAGALIDDLSHCHLERRETKFPTFELFLDTDI